MQTMIDLLPCVKQNRGITSLSFFPNEVIELIFVHCDNILELTQVCPRFNDIISKSPLFMRKLTVEWNVTPKQDRRLARKKNRGQRRLSKQQGLQATNPGERNASILLNSQRKYQSLSLVAGRPEHFDQVYSFIEDHRGTLVNLQIKQNFKLEEWQNYQLLSTLSRNLKKLSTSELSIQVPEESLGVLKFPNLEEWSCSSNVSNFWFQGWGTPKLIKFVCFNAKENNENPEGLLGFLRDQPQLQDLEIRHHSDVKNFLEENESRPFNFNLTRLKVGGDSNVNCTRILRFIESQGQSLKKLSLVTFVLPTEHFLKILELELEELEFVDMQYFALRVTNSRNYSLDKLSLLSETPELRLHDYERSLIAVIESCPTVETLCIQGYDISRDLSRTIASSQIKNLELTGNSFSFPLQEMKHFPSLITFSAKSINRRFGESFVAKNPQLRLIRTEYRAEYVRNIEASPKIKVFKPIVKGSAIFLLFHLCVDPSNLPAAALVCVIVGSLIWLFVAMYERHVRR